MKCTSRNENISVHQQRPLCSELGKVTLPATNQQMQVGHGNMRCECNRQAGNWDTKALHYGTSFSEAMAGLQN